MNYPNISLSLFIALALNGTSLAMQPVPKKNQPNKSVDFFLSNNRVTASPRQRQKKSDQNNENNNSQKQANKKLVQLSSTGKKQIDQITNKNQNITNKQQNNNQRKEEKLQTKTEKNGAKKKIIQQEKDRVEVEMYGIVDRVDQKMTGIFFRDEEGDWRRISKKTQSYDGYCMMKNQLSNLNYYYCPKKFREDDFQHNFNETIEQTYGHLACVFIDNCDLDKVFEGSEELDLRITLPGKMDTIEYKNGKRKILASEPGVFEFAVQKSLYEEEGVCLHRFFNIKNGEFGAEGFGAEFREQEAINLEYSS